MRNHLSFEMPVGDRKVKVIYPMGRLDILSYTLGDDFFTVLSEEGCIMNRRIKITGFDRDFDGDYVQPKIHSSTLEGKTETQLVLPIGFNNLFIDVELSIVKDAGHTWGHCALFIAARRLSWPPIGGVTRTIDIPAVLATKKEAA